MPDYQQADRPLRVTTPLGPDKLLIVGFEGTESLSQPFEFTLDLIASNEENIGFDKLLGQKLTVAFDLSEQGARYFNGICQRISQGERDAVFTSYSVTLVPELALCRRRINSRIFQQKSIPEILKEVFKGMDVSYELKGTYEPRDFCAQYRETDFDFAGRLMEEEGIYFFFKHKDGGHSMVVADTPQSHPDVPQLKEANFEGPEGGGSAQDRVIAWQKSQELPVNKVTLWDHSFQLPGKKLDADKTIPDSVTVGTVSHKLKFSEAERYEFPGGYAGRFDGISKSGGEQASDLQKIFQDNSRVAEIRAQQEVSESLTIGGMSTHREFTAGHKFKLANHFNGDGKYILLDVNHSIQLSGDYRTGGAGMSYTNTFTCFPADMPFRPKRKTAKPLMRGTQTAIVVGPSGEEIFTDKYGRVKVQFHWDRDGKNDASSSCWVRVGQIWAGKQWGAMHIPRIGQEVIVAFQEGDIDEPIIVGSVYNAEMMPPYTLPDNKTQSGLKSRSTLSGGSDNFNELRFEDKKGSEDVYFHAEKDFHRVVENDDDLKVGNDQKIEIKKNRTEEVKEGNETIKVSKGNRAVEIAMGNEQLTIKMGNQTTKLDLGKSETEAMQSIEFKVGQSSVKIDQTGVTIKGMMVKVEGQIQTDIKGTITQVQGTAMLKAGGGITMIG